MGIRFEFNFLIHHPVFQHISAIADQVAWTRPVSAAFNIGFLHRVKREIRSKVRKPWQRLIELHPQRMGIDRRHAKLIRRRFAINDILRVGDSCKRRKPGKR
jgi:soluble lytic murein transglycosylase-like protein